MRATSQLYEALLNKREDELVIVFADNCFYSLSSSHRSFFAHQGSDSAKSKASDFGNLPKDGGPDTMLYLQLVHHNQMFLFLLPHVLIDP